MSHWIFCKQTFTSKVIIFFLPDIVLHSYQIPYHLSLFHLRHSSSMLRCNQSHSATVGMWSNNNLKQIQRIIALLFEKRSSLNFSLTRDLELTNKQKTVTDDMNHSLLPKVLITYHSTLPSTQSNAFAKSTNTMYISFFLEKHFFSS